MCADREHDRARTNTHNFSFTYEFFAEAYPTGVHIYLIKTAISKTKFLDYTVENFDYGLALPRRPS